MTAYQYIQPVLFKILTGYCAASTGYAYDAATEAKRDALETEFNAGAQTVLETIATPFVDIGAAFLAETNFGCT